VLGSAPSDAASEGWQTCARAASHGRARVADGLMVVQRMEQHGVEGNAKLYNSLMDLVAKSALFGFAGPLDGYAVLRRMRDGGVAPTVVTFNALLEVRYSSRARATTAPPKALLSHAPPARPPTRATPSTARCLGPSVPVHGTGQVCGARDGCVGQVRA
jgi:hypothetical protein